MVCLLRQLPFFPASHLIFNSKRDYISSHDLLLKREYDPLCSRSLQIRALDINKVDLIFLRNT